MPRLPTGHVRYRNGRWTARVTLAPGNRPTFSLDRWHRPDDEHAAQERAGVLSDLAAELRRAGALDLAPNILKRAAGADDEELAKVVGLVAKLAAGKAERADDMVPADYSGTISPWPTCRGVYFVACLGRVKIGYSKCVRRRLMSLSTAAPAALALLAVERGADPTRERDLHARFGDERVHGEWFVPTRRLVRAIHEARLT